MLIIERRGKVYEEDLVVHKVFDVDKKSYIYGFSMSMDKDSKFDIDNIPVCYWKSDNEATIRINLRFMDLTRDQRNLALLYIAEQLEGVNIPQRIKWDFDTRIPADKLEGIVSYTPHS